MIMMRFFLPLTTSHVVRVFVVVGLGVVASASCGIDESGLNSMAFLPHDAAAHDTAAGAAGTGGPGAAGTGGSIVPSGLAGSSAGVGGDGSGGTGGSVNTGGTGGEPTTGDAGTTGAAGATGDGGTGGGNVGRGGVTGTGGSAAAGTGGAMTGGAGTGGNAGTTGVAGAGGLAGTTGIGGIGGIGGGAGVGGRGGAGARGGTGGVVVPCTAANCADGCCNGTACVRMRSATQCGAMGAACAPCGGCQTCSAMGQCKIDAASRWTIRAVSAQLSTNSNWDRSFGEIGGTAPDPFCEFENPAGQVTTTTAGVTDTLTDTYNPKWNQVITPVGATVSAMALMANSPTWQIWVGDDDGCTPGQTCLGDVACTFRSPITEAQLKAGEVVVNNRQSCVSLTIDFVCQPM